MAKYDVVKDYDWTSAPRGSSIRKQAPRVWVKSYKLKSNQIMQMIDGYKAITTSAGKDAKSFYDKMYSDSVVDASGEDDFNFPFFGDNVRSFGNTFGDTFQNGIGGGGGIGESFKNATNTMIGLGASAIGAFGSKNVVSAASQASGGNYADAFNTLVGGIKSGGDPGSYVETPMFYQFEKNDAPLEVSFVVSNTINSDYDKNHKLVQRLTYINRPLRNDSISVDPPRIYQVRVPGHRLIRWAYCSNFSVNFLGTRRIINNVIVPEGYQITMSFTSLTLEHAGFGKDETQLN
jgi:hypothetical protein